MDVDRVMVPIAFDVHAEIEGNSAEIMHPEPLLHSVLDLLSEALVSNDAEIMELQNDRGNDYAVIFKHE